MATNSRPLTVKQHKFAQELPGAKSATEAAIKAGYSNSSEAASVRAAELVRNSRVTDAIKANQLAATSEAIMSVIKRKERLSRLAEPDPEHPDPIRAIDTLNRMENLYVMRTANVNIDVDVELETFSLEDLRLMLAAAKDAKALKGKGDAAE